MFEANPPSTAQAARDCAQEGELRPLTWSDLRSRLEAARDLRATLLAGACEAHASFDSLSAGGLAGQEDGKQRVNPDDLANGKGPCGITAEDKDSGTGSDPRE